MSGKVDRKEDPCIVRRTGVVPNSSLKVDLASPEHCNLGLCSTGAVSKVGVVKCLEFFPSFQNKSSIPLHPTTLPTK